MKKIFTLLFLSASIFASAQNLVPNPGFEVQDSCPIVSELFVCQPWKSPTLGTPDAYRSTCPTQNAQGHTGTGSSGIFLFDTFLDNREYMQAPLTSSLIGGQMYYVSFWVKRLNYRYASNRIGAYFSVGAVNNMATTDVLAYSPQVDNSPSHMLSASGWINIAGSFVASGGEDHIVIGSFSTDSQTDTLVANATNSSKVAYYQVDDVSVTVTGSGVNEIYANENRISVFPNPSTGKFRLDAVTMKEPELKIYNSLGSVVYESILNSGGADIDMSNYSKGIYFIRMNSNDVSADKRIIIQ